MSHNSGGFFSLNRLFGKKIKHEKTSSMGLSKSTSQTLSRSNTNPDEVSPQNKITPLTTIPNAPFEQTFRITVYLPLGQLYVARIGAKTKLSELLNTICTNKSLDSTKYYFKHPTDDTQVFDVSSTVGEVGLSEIKLAPKNIKEDTGVRYRLHSNFSRENRFVARPHTMSSVSPYSSTNSLNSTDSSGIMMNQRVNNSGVPVAPNRKKRIAPRPPSQNSIPENPENICSKDELNSPNSGIGEDSKVDSNHSNLLRQNFHMSSPNLAMSTSMSFKSSEIDINTSVTNSFDRRQSENCLNNSKKVSLNRPLSIQLSKTTNDDHSREFKSQISENLNSRQSQCHSRAPSEINESIFPEPQPRTRPPINKKKAPAPPPRTVSTNSNGQPVATPRNAVSKLSIDDAKDDMIDDKAHESIRSPDLDSPIMSVKKQTNVSKVMLNVNETQSNSDDNVNKSNNDANVDKRRSDDNVIKTEPSCHEETVISHPKDQEKINTNEETTEAGSKSKSISVVNLNSSDSEQIEKLNETDHTAVSLQVNEIIDEAVKMNEARISAEMNGEHKNDSQVENIHEINNNNDNNDKDHDDVGVENERELWDNHQDKHSPQKQISYTDSENLKTATAEVPIQPILNETRSFSFHEYNDNSLPTSTTSTLNTTETPSTGPESLITSDIEDGYKGNELEKKRKPQVVKCDSKEDFIESQFEFLKEHLDNKMNNDSDEEKTIEFSKQDIISSTMITENRRISDKIQNVDRNDVINELTQIISCNRLDTFIKPNTQSNDSVAASKRSSLKNFQISAYSNGNFENTKSKPISYVSEASSQQSSNAIEYGDKSGSQSTFDSNGPSIEDDTISNGKSDETFVIAKQINRSVSFHSTSANAMDDEANATDADSGSNLYTTQRCSSYLSLNGPPKYEQNTVQSQENCQTGSVRRKSSSELSIADTPSLQSIKVMKSILNSSIKLNPESKSIQKEEKTSVAYENEVDTDSQLRSDALKQQSVTTNPKKTWSYQGPPSINFSTWGDRPKSTVNIKSDEDYIFGKTSKMAALQKRFSGIETEKRKDVHPSAEATFKKPNMQCDSGVSKLPVVRSVEYKKNVSHNADSPDSSQQVTSFRPNYEVSHIVSENSFTKKVDAFPKDRTENIAIKAVPIKPTISTQSINSNINYMPRVQSFNIPNKTQSINQLKVTKEVETKELEKPIFTQFKLRKTGLKEKMFDRCSEDDLRLSNGSKAENSAKPIPTAPKPPPPTLAKPKIRPVSMDNKIDTRGQLLDSIRNFKRDSLKRNVIY